MAGHLLRCDDQQGRALLAPVHMRLPSQRQTWTHPEERACSCSVLNESLTVALARHRTGSSAMATRSCELNPAPVDRNVPRRVAVPRMAHATVAESAAARAYYRAWNDDVAAAF